MKARRIKEGKEKKGIERGAQREVSKKEISESKSLGVRRSPKDGVCAGSTEQVPPYRPFGNLLLNDALCGHWRPRCPTPPISMSPKSRAQTVSRCLLPSIVSRPNTRVGVPYLLPSSVSDGSPPRSTSADLSHLFIQIIFLPFWIS